MIQRCKKRPQIGKRKNEEDSPEKERRARRARTNAAEQRAKKRKEK
jgi:hypothetical protein